MKSKIVVVFIICISLFSISFAHPGRTDSNGGHYDRSTGEYHYHDGDGGLLQIGTEEEGQEIIDDYEKQIEELQEQLSNKDEIIEELNKNIEEKDDIIIQKEINRATLHFIYWFIIICMGISIWNLSRDNKK